MPESLSPATLLIAGSLMTALPILVAIYRVERTDCTDRKRYGLALLGAMSFFFISSTSSAFLSKNAAPVLFGMVTSAAFFGFLYVFAKRLAGRCNDVGCSRWFTLLMLLPYVNIAFVLAMVVAPGKTKMREDPV